MLPGELTDLKRLYNFPFELRSIELVGLASRARLLANENCDLDARLSKLHNARMSEDDPHRYCAFSHWYSSGIWFDLKEARARFRNWDADPSDLLRELRRGWRVGRQTGSAGPRRASKRVFTHWLLARRLRCRPRL